MIHSTILTPDIADQPNAPKDPWSQSLDPDASEYARALFANTPWCAKGDDLDDDEAYFLEDDDDDDDDAEDDYDDEDDDDDDDGGSNEDSDQEDDDEEL